MEKVVCLVPVRYDLQRELTGMDLSRCPSCKHGTMIDPPPEVLERVKRMLADSYAA